MTTATIGEPGSLVELHGNGAGHGVERFVLAGTAELVRDGERLLVALLVPLAGGRSCRLVIRIAGDDTPFAQPCHRIATAGGLASVPYRSGERLPC